MFPKKRREKGVSALNFFITVRAKIVTELILERAGQIVLKTFLLKLIAFRLIPVICPARRAKPEDCWEG